MTSLILPGPMVRAVLQGTKTQHRVPLKKRPPENTTYDESSKLFRVGASQVGLIRAFKYLLDPEIWVKETYALARHELDRYFYKEAHDGPAFERMRDSWRSAYHMPQEASRLTLEVTSVRVERLQEISEEDAKAEGVPAMHLDDLGQTWKTHKRGFESDWNSRFKKRPELQWDRNPWVFVLRIRRVEG